MSSEHLILADSIKKVHQQLRHDVNQSIKLMILFRLRESIYFYY